MSFDETKVQFTPEEMDAARSADRLYEIFYEAFSDGLDLSDIGVIPQAMPHIISLYTYYAGGTKAEYAKKLIAMGVAILRDNDFLDLLDDDDE